MCCTKYNRNNYPSQLRRLILGTELVRDAPFRITMANFDYRSDLVAGKHAIKNDTVCRQKPSVDSKWQESADWCALFRQLFADPPLG